VIKTLPSRLQTKLWSSQVKDLDVVKDKSLITHRILSYGDLNDIQSLFRIYSMKDLQQTFLTKPMKLYTKSGVNFVKDYILNMENTYIDDSAYVKTLY